jgi:Protein of unknown function (DUF2490)
MGPRPSVPKLLFSLTAGCMAVAAASPNAQEEFWPEVDGYVALSPSTRLQFRTSFKNHPMGDSWEGNFGIHLDLALRPVFRRELRERGDAFKRRFLSFRTGYEYLTNLTDHSAPYVERRWIVECSSRFLLPGKAILSDRNRGDLRLVNGQPFSTRYRNRLQLERDYSLGRFVITPYVDGELFYDTRYDAWTRNRYSVGIQVPAGDHFVLETYGLRQNDSKSSKPHINVVGLKFLFYF